MASLEFATKLGLDRDSDLTSETQNKSELGTFPYFFSFFFS